MPKRNDVTVTFKAQTEKFDQQIKKSNQSLSGLRTQMKLSEATFKNTDALGCGTYLMSHFFGGRDVFSVMIAQKRTLYSP